ncbi:P-loop containing nucleoside triphosphate hydrolase protein [Pyrenochaeta sp. DS3sAY3a]|nr:P-loop containing nucleoside triphosphate hydrolase protein [Pyrenochaeta sp. DS3sAY3a]
MASIPRPVCSRCIRALHRQYSTENSNPQTRPQSPQNGSPTTAPESSELQIKKHWNTDFRVKSKMTWASRTALQYSTTRTFNVTTTSTRPPGHWEQPWWRVKDGASKMRPPPKPIEPPRLPGRDFIRPSRTHRYSNDLKYGEPLVPPAGGRHQKSATYHKADLNWWWETVPPTIYQKGQASRFFASYGRNVKMLRSVAQFRDFPASDVPEVAFVGRSNVGKSSLLNAVVSDSNNASVVARTSATRGFTKTMNLYGIGTGTGVSLKRMPNGTDKIVALRGLTIVDMPGYGDGSLAEWGVEIMKYIQGRKQLRRVFVLVDAQHGLKDKDRSLLASLRLAGVSHQVVLSKIDKLYIPASNTAPKRAVGKALRKVAPKGSPELVRAEMEKLRPEIQPGGGGALGEILAVSAETVVGGQRLGIDDLRFAVLKAVGLEGDPMGVRVKAESGVEEDGGAEAERRDS